MPYKARGKCVYKKDTGKKVGCTDGDVKKYLAALYANTNETNEAKKYRPGIDPAPKPLPQRAEPSYVWDDKTQSFRDDQGREPPTKFVGAGLTTKEWHARKKEKFIDLLFSKIFRPIDKIRNNIAVDQPESDKEYLRGLELEEKFTYWWNNSRKLINNLFDNPTNKMLVKILQTLAKDKHLSMIYNKTGVINSIVKNITKSQIWMAEKYRRSQSGQIRRQVSEDKKMKITKSQLKQLIKEELESVTEMFGRTVDGPTYDDDISQNVFSPEEGIEAAKQIQTAAARLKQVIEGLKQEAGGMTYDSMDLALGSLKNMKVEYYLDRIIDRLERYN